MAAEHLRRRGGIWYATIYIDGRRVERSTGCTSKAAARTVLADWERRAADPHRAAEDHTLEGALNLVLEDRAARARNGDGSEVTVTFYKKSAGHAVRVLGYELSFARIRDASTIWQYIDQRRSEGAADITIDKEVVLLIDLGVPLEVVSRILGHADTRITELVYCRVSDDDLFDRMLDALDPRYAQRATAARGERKHVATVTSLPEPKPGPTKFVIDGIARTLDEWAARAGISKTTL